MGDHQTKRAPCQAQSDICRRVSELHERREKGGGGRGQGKRSSPFSVATATTSKSSRAVARTRSITSSTRATLLTCSWSATGTKEEEWEQRNKGQGVKTSKRAGSGASLLLLVCVGNNHLREVEVFTEVLDALVGQEPVVVLPGVGVANIPAGTERRGRQMLLLPARTGNSRQRLHQLHHLKVGDVGDLHVGTSVLVIGSDNHALCNRKLRCAEQSLQCNREEKDVQENDRTTA
eukprot:131414-Hanusia_phi.AAC.4